MWTVLGVFEVDGLRNFFAGMEMMWGFGECVVGFGDGVLGARVVLWAGGLGGSLL